MRSTFVTQISVYYVCCDIPKQPISQNQALCLGLIKLLNYNKETTEPSVPMTIINLDSYCRAAEAILMPVTTHKFHCTLLSKELE